MKNRIEKGCIALIVKSHNGHEGKVVTVGSYLGYVPGYGYRNRWEIDRHLTVDHPDYPGETVNHLDESQLMRIDGCDEETATEQGATGAIDAPGDITMTDKNAEVQAAEDAKRPGDVLVMRDLDDFEEHLCKEIDFISGAIHDLAVRERELRNLFLTKNGWNIASEMIGPSKTYFYRKGDEMFICEHEAMDYDLYGA